jgi:hypothetical protein
MAVFQIKRALFGSNVLLWRHILGRRQINIFFDLVGSFAAPDA